MVGLEPAPAVEVVAEVPEAEVAEALLWPDIQPLPWPITMVSQISSKITSICQFNKWLNKIGSSYHAVIS